MFRRSVARLLRDRYDVLAANSCEAALELLAEQATSVSLVLLDITFPPETLQGDQALERIRERWPWLGVIMLTVQPELSLVLKCTRLGALDYVSKLADLTLVLPDAVTRALAIGDLRRQHEELQRELRRTQELEQAMARGAGAGPALPAPTPDRIRPFDEVMRAHFTHALEACGGNMAEAARRLQLPYDTYRDQLIAWGVVQPGRRKE
ncbi:MAG: response regulator [Deltaproteobacteria bacterium]|nr:response regulator [Deltaproteobacteria bacterium]